MHFIALVAIILTQANTPVDVSKVKAKLQLLTDGHGRYFVLNPEEPFSEMFFSGDGKKLYQDRVFGGGKNGEEAWDVMFWDPRAPLTNGRPEILMKDENRVFELHCGKTVKLTLVTDPERQQILDGATFLPPLWTRRPENLMRDQSGNYFFVDRLRTDDNTDRRDFRVFMGPRGKMKQLPLKDIVDDSKGTIFATKDGTLRLIRNRGGDDQVMKWVVGHQETVLTDVPVEDNVRMIYLDLGPYSGLPLGTPCDGLL